MATTASVPKSNPNRSDDALIGPPPHHLGGSAGRRGRNDVLKLVTGATRLYSDIVTLIVTVVLFRAGSSASTSGSTA
jgi:hypothetical protein